MKKLFTNEELLNILPEFIDVFSNRPIKNNFGGMSFNHSFGLFAILKKLKVKNVYESGIWKGNSTWIIENCSSKFNIVSIDINLNLREYVSGSTNVIYFEGDISELSFKDIDVENTIVFFDDHSNAIDRLKFLYSWGIKYAIFEDNYPVGQGDAYSPRKIFNKSGQSIHEWFPNYKEPVNRFTRYKILNKFYKKFFFSENSLPYFLKKYYYYQKKIRKPNSADLELFNKLVKNYYEIQPVYRYDKQRWPNSNWSGHYESLDPLFKDLDKNEFSEKLKIFEEQDPNRMYEYTYISLVELNV